MSRIVVFDGNGISLGEVHANCNRSWALNEGGTAEITLDDAQLADWLEIGNFVLVEDARLPSWGGMIDTPWTATLPVVVTAYSAEWFYAIRSPRAVHTLTGTAGEIMLQCLARINRQGELFLRQGEVDFSDPERVESFDMRPFWEQMQELAERSGMEIQVRAGRDFDNTFQALLDVAPRIGVDTGYLLHDGEGANMEIMEARVDGEIWNSIVGIGDQATGESRLKTESIEDMESVGRYRLRTKTVQYSGVTGMNTLEDNVRADLAANSTPKLYLAVNVLDQGDAFQHMRLGNGLIVQASRVRLPGGQHGWRGIARITAMTYDEGLNSVGLSLEGEV